ncbi:hypothetical protein NQ318_022701 [Aromia moschata]|uniref:Protein NDNF C-terminal domain-containing protein n=1 Tax=Aromia moschata TaxID=1265417 RepID=A0AAV8YAK5_9CUCU|nr:hypothetical protein NQ318_022701 [Aromia moschata]
MSSLDLGEFQVDLENTFPTMPSETAVQEYESLSKCDSVTIGWLPAPGSKVGHYCIMTDDYALPNQCGVENRLRKDKDFTLQFCKDIPHNLTQ